MGLHKLTLPLDTVSLGSIALESALHSILDGIIVVTQEHDSLAWISPRLRSGSLREKWVHAPCSKSTYGQSESLKCGLRTAQELGSEAIMVLLADQPFTPIHMINLFVSLYKSNKLKYITAYHSGITRPPVLFDASMFPELLKLEGDEGARSLLRHRQMSQGLAIEYKNAEYFVDIDTPTDYQGLIKA